MNNTLFVVVGVLAAAPFIWMYARPRDRRAEESFYKAIESLIAFSMCWGAALAIILYQILLSIPR